jgi:uncharacterized protein (TIGR02118 family)
MQCMTILYPNKEGAKFDFDYYVQTHVPLANGLLGHEFTVTRGISSAQGGPSPFLCIARMDIGTVSEFMPVLMQHVEGLAKDIPNYTNVEPVILFEEVL